MHNDSITDERLKQIIKKNAIKSTTALWVFLVTEFIGFCIVYSSIDSIGGTLGIIMVLVIPAGAAICVLCKRAKQIDTITESFQSTIENNKEYSIDLIEKKLDKSAKVFSDAGYDYSLGINQTIRKWMLIFPRKKEQYMFDFTMLIDFEIYEDGNKTALGTQVNGITLGTITDICKDLHVEIIVNATQQSRLLVPLITESCTHDSAEYRYAVDSAKEICSLLSIVKADTTADRVPNTTASNFSIQEQISEKSNVENLDEISKLFELKKQGAITEEEFTVKKKQILGV